MITEPIRKWATAVSAYFSFDRIFDRHPTDLFDCKSFSDHHCMRTTT